MPNDTLSYARVPSIWFLFSQQDNGFKFAQGNKTHVEQLRKIQDSLKQNIFSQLPKDLILAQFFMSHLNGPIEAPVLNAKEGKMPMLAVAMSLKFNSLDQFKQAFANTLNVRSEIEVVQQTDDQGNGVLRVQAMDIVYRYDVATKQFAVYVAVGDTVENINKKADSLLPNTTHPMFALEKKIDTSGVGLFLWATPKLVLNSAQPFVPPNVLKDLQSLGLSDLNNLALGYGVSNKKTRLTVIIDKPKSGTLSSLPSVKNNIELDAVGSVNSFALLSLPTNEHLTGFEKAMADVTGGPSTGYNVFKHNFQQELNLPLSSLVAMVGPELVYFSDDISNFLAIRLNNESEFDALMKTLESKKLVTLSTHNNRGVTIYQAVSSSSSFGVNFADLPDVPPIVAILLSNLKSHYFWTKEDGFIILSAVPQPLMERASRKDRVSIANWLNNRQHQDFSGTLIGFSGSLDGISRTSYHYYLQMVQFIGDISDAQFDIFSFPLASELGFSEHGTIGVNVNVSNPYISVEFTFEQSVLDALYVGGYFQTTAMIGILSAIAIPAYNEYENKVKAATYSTL